MFSHCKVPKGVRGMATYTKSSGKDIFTSVQNCINEPPKISKSHLMSNLSRCRREWGMLTINQNESFVVMNRNGNVRVITGPKTLPLFGTRTQELKYYSANEDQAIRIQKMTGQLEYKKGPIGIWDDPVHNYGIDIINLEELSAGPNQFIKLKHRNGREEFINGPVAIRNDYEKYKSIEVLEGINIDQHEVIVVYEGDKVKHTRKILYGPTVYRPKGNEWVHQFGWHGADPENRHRKVPGALQFFKLRAIPDQMYINVPCVRTNDDILITINVMVFFRLKNIEKMLDNSHDVIADINASTTADILEFVSKRSFEEFKDAIEALNTREIYKELIKRAESIGYEISDVVFRGYEAPTQIQEMHNEAVVKRTSLTLDRETTEQEESLKSFKLENESDRRSKMQKMAKEEQEHDLFVKKRDHQEKLREERDNLIQGLELSRLKSEEDIRDKEEEQRVQRIKYDDEINYYSGLAHSGTDLTKYFEAKFSFKPDRHIKIDGLTKGDVVPKIYVEPQ